MASNNSDCQACNKKGFPILLSRFGFSSSPNSKTPIMPPADYPKINSQGSYVLRMLREGYVYVYDELDQSLSCFRVSDQSVYKKIPLSLPVSQAVTQPMHQPCMLIPERVANGMLITIPKAEISRKVWIGFSSHLWTNRICQLHIKNASYRSHMTEVIVGSGGKNSCSIHQVNQIADFSKVSLGQVLTNIYSIEKGSFYLKTTPNSPLLATAQKLNSKQQSIVNAADKLAPNKGVIVALTDTVALMAEIAGSIDYQLTNYLHDKGHTKKSTTDMTLTTIKMNLHDNVQHKYANQDTTRNTYNANLNKIREAKKLSALPVDKVMEEKYQDWEYKQVALESTEEWLKYSSKLKTGERESWRQQYQADMKAYDKKVVFPLATLHVTWQKHARSIAYFDKTFDSTDPNSGANYQHEVIVAANNIFATEPAAKYVLEQLQSKDCKTEYFVLNALLLNNDKLKQTATAALSAVKPAIDNPLRDLAWDGIMGAHVEAAKRVFENKAEIYGGWLISGISGAILKYSQAILNGKIGVGIIAVAMATKERFTVLSFVARKEQLLEMVTRHFIATAKENAPVALQQKLNNPAYVKNLVKYRLSEIRRLSGINLSQQVKIRMVIARSVLADANNMDDALRAIGLQGEIKLQLNLKWKDAVKRGAGAVQTSASNATKAHLSFGAGVLTGAFQVWVLNKLISDVQDPNMMLNNKIENWARLSVGIGALVGTVGAVIDEGIGKLPTRYVGSFLGWLKGVGGRTGKYLGPGAAIAGALVDIYKFNMERLEGNTAVSNLYLVSGLAGGIAGGTVIAAMSPTYSIPYFGWILAACAAVVVITGVATSYLKDNALQDWVERCSFGKLTEQRYPTLIIEQQELVNAYKGMGA